MVVQGVKEHCNFFKYLMILSGTFVLVILIGFLDYVADPYLSFLIFYLIPILLATWFVTCEAGYLILSASFIVWVIDDIHDSPSFGHPIVPYWDLSLKLIFCFIFIRILCFIKELLQRIQRQNEELKKMNQLKTQFVANVSHEVKSPLSILLESLSIVLDGGVGALNTEQRNILQIGKTAIQRLLRLVSDLLDLSKIEAGKFELKIEAIDLGRLLEEVLIAYEQDLLLKKITITKNIPKDLGVLWADRDRLTQVIVNLLANAIKYMSGSGAIVITLKGTPEEVRFEIKDTGLGIAKEYFQKIFDKFERAAFAGKQDGAGLGLPITKDIIELHRGKIWVESEIGKGSLFIFTLPRNLRKPDSV